jgi:hypothetical protein
MAKKNEKRCLSQSDRDEAEARAASAEAELLAMLDLEAGTVKKGKKK